MSICTLKDVDIRGKRVLIREDLNVPVVEGKVVSDARIRAALPTLRYAVEQGARTMVMSHLGRPQEGVPISEQVDASLAPVADRIEELSGLSVALVEATSMVSNLSTRRLSCLKMFELTQVKRTMMLFWQKNLRHWLTYLSWMHLEPRTVLKRARRV